MFKKTKENVENITSMEDEEKLSKLKSDTKIVAKKIAKIGIVATAFVVCYKLAKSSTEAAAKEETTSTDEEVIED